MGLYESVFDTIMNILKMLLLLAAFLLVAMGCAKLALELQPVPACADMHSVKVYRSDGEMVQQFCRPGTFVVFSE